MTVLIPIVELVCLVLLVMNIYESSRRWLSIGYAILAFATPIVLGFILLFVLRSGIDTIGTAITLASPIAAVVGSSIPPRRVKSTP